MGGVWRWGYGTLSKFGTQSDLGVEFEPKVTRACFLQVCERLLRLSECCCSWTKNLCWFEAVL